MKEVVVKFEKFCGDRPATAKVTKHGVLIEDRDDPDGDIYEEMFPWEYLRTWTTRNDKSDPYFKLGVCMLALGRKMGYVK